MKWLKMVGGLLVFFFFILINSLNYLFAINVINFVIFVIIPKFIIYIINAVELNYTIYYNIYIIYA